MKSLMGHYEDIINKAEIDNKKPALIVISRERFEVLEKELSKLMNYRVMAPDGIWEEKKLFRPIGNSFFYYGVCFTTNPKILTETYVEWGKIE